MTNASPTSLAEIRHRHENGSAEPDRVTRLATAIDDIGTCLTHIAALEAEKQEAHDEVARLINEVNERDLKLAESQLATRLLPLTDEEHYALNSVCDFLEARGMKSVADEHRKTINRLLSSGAATPAPTAGTEPLKHHAMNCSVWTFGKDRCNCGVKP